MWCVCNELSVETTKQTQLRRWCCQAGVYARCCCCRQCTVLTEDSHRHRHRHTQLQSWLWLWAHSRYCQRETLVASPPLPTATSSPNRPLTDLCKQGGDGSKQNQPPNTQRFAHAHCSVLVWRARLRAAVFVCVLPADDKRGFSHQRNDESIVYDYQQPMMGYGLCDCCVEDRSSITVIFFCFLRFEGLTRSQPPTF